MTQAAQRFSFLWRVSLYLLLLLGTQKVIAQQTIEGLGLDFSFADDVPGADRKEENAGKKGFFSKFDFSGYLKNETAYRFREPRSFTKIRDILYLDAKYPINETARVFFAGWAYHDLVYNLFDYDTVAARSERNQEEPLVFVERLAEERDSHVMAIRELYVDASWGELEMRVGKQYVIWGVLEGVRIVDEINPMDFREMILPDLLDYRISLWTLKLDYYTDSADYQLLWIPDVKFHKPAPRGSEWELLQDVCAEQEADILCITNKPKSFSLENSEIGFRVGKTIFDTELTLSYLYTWDDFPVIFRTIRIPRERATEPTASAFYPTYTRISMYGATAVKQFGSYIFKSELAYVTDKYFGVRNTTDEDGDEYLDYDGAIKRDHVRYGIGLEFNIWETDFAPGLTRWTILDYHPSIIQGRHDTAYNLFIRKEFPAYAATFQMLLIRLVNLDELLAKPKITFQVDDHLQIAAGLDLFFGRTSDFGANTATAVGTFDPAIARAQFFGNFHDNDRLYMEFKYSF